MTYSQFIEDLEQEFYKVLDLKTSWGRNDLKLELDRAIVRTLAKHLER